MTGPGTRARRKPAHPRDDTPTNAVLPGVDAGGMYRVWDVLSRAEGIGGPASGGDGLGDTSVWRRVVSALRMLILTYLKKVMTVGHFSTMREAGPLLTVPKHSVNAFCCCQHRQPTSVPPQPGSPPQHTTNQGPGARPAGSITVFFHPRVLAGPGPSRWSHRTHPWAS